MPQLDAPAVDNAARSSDLSVEMPGDKRVNLPPVVTAFSMPSTATSLTVPVTAFLATDRQSGIGYKITESATPPSTTSAWPLSPPASFTFSAAGTRTAYAWAMDSQGAVSASRSATVTITLPNIVDTVAPVVTAFSMSSTAGSLSVPVTVFTASDNVRVTGYLLTESSAKPLASAAGWSATAPASFVFSGEGSMTAYAWAKDAAGNVSESRSASSAMSSGALDSSVLGTLYGDPSGLSRVAALEVLLHGMKVKSEHPRIFMTPELIDRGRQRVAAGHTKWAAIQSSANSGNTLNAAFAFLMLQERNPAQAAVYAATVYNNIMAGTAGTWAANYDSGVSGSPDRKVAEWSIAFDWVYNGLTPQQRDALIAKIAAHADLTARAQWIRGGGRDTGANGETFHREEWIFNAWKAWPELALAGHITDAEFCYKTRWRYDWVQGDAARVYAYLNDGTPLEGYQYGADATSWFMALKSATGINLVDGPLFHYDKAAADYQLYGMDFGLNRNVFHHGVGAGAGGLWTYTGSDGTDSNWKLKEYHSVATQLTAPDNPYQQWFAVNTLTFGTRGASSWIFTNEYYNRWENFESIATVLFYDPTLPARDPRLATYEELPFAKHFEGGNEVYMRTSWGNDAAMACFRSTPAFTKSAHGDFDVNTFVLYRKGNLAPDSGVYDNLAGQTNYMKYQKNTVAHNNLLVVDPAKPDAPTKLSSSTPDPGGTELVSTRTFGNIHPVFSQATSTFLLNPKANWADIVAFETQRDFDYAVGDAAAAYGSRLNEYTRALLFLRKPGDKAYVLIHDRVNATQANFQKKWLLHTVNEPALNGSVLNTEVPDHIFTTDGDSYSATNAFNNSALYGKALLPVERRIRKVGGAGYEFWVDGSSPRNWPIDWATIASSKESYMGGPLQEIGQWRLELMPAVQRQRDVFLNVIYLGDAGESLAPTRLVTTSVGSRIGVLIQDSVTQNYLVLFNQNVFGGSSVDTFSYTIDASTALSTSIKHVITEVAPGRSFTISKDGAVVKTSTSSAKGILSFTANGSGTYSVVRDQ